MHSHIVGLLLLIKYKYCYLVGIQAFLLWNLNSRDKLVILRLHVVSFLIFTGVCYNQQQNLWNYVTLVFCSKIWSRIDRCDVHVYWCIYTNSNSRSPSHLDADTRVMYIQMLKIWLCVFHQQTIFSWHCLKMLCVKKFKTNNNTFSFLFVIVILFVKNHDLICSLESVH